jgi:hypothetical protein
MNLFVRSLVPLASIAALGAVTACSGSTQSPTPQARAPLSLANSAYWTASSPFANSTRSEFQPKPGEYLFGKASVRPEGCGGSIFGATFRASGKAYGPLPGSFTAEGSWSGSLSGSSWSFTGSFTITAASGQTTVTMRPIGPLPSVLTCHDLSRAAIQVHFPNYYANAKIKSIRKGVFRAYLGIKD